MWNLCVWVEEVLGTPKRVLRMRALVQGKVVWLRQSAAEDEDCLPRTCRSVESARAFRTC